MSDLGEVFLVYHKRELEDDAEEVKFIGVFSNLEIAENVINKIKSKPGFCDFPDGFLIDPCKLDVFEWEDGFDYTSDAYRRDTSIDC